MMQSNNFALCCALLLSSPSALAANLFSSIADDETLNRWRGSIGIESNYMRAKGSLVNASAISDEVGSSFFSDAKAMQLDEELTPSLALYLHKGRWSAGFHHTSIDYDGVGTGNAAISTESLGGFFRLPLQSEISLQLYYASLHYNLVQTPDSIFGLGVGGGVNKVNIDLHSGNQFSFLYDEDEPYGFVSVHMANRHGAFYYGFVLNAIAMNSGDVTESFSQYQLDLGYRLIEGKQTVDITAGWQLQKLTYKLNNAGGALAADLELSGPQLGVSFSW